MIRAESFGFEAADIVDFHSHILPGVDHGSADLECSLKQLSLAKKHSVSRILATPHFYPNEHITSTFIEARDKAADLLKKSAGPDMPLFKLGAEVLICEGLERFPDLDKLCFQNSKYIMLELPFIDFTEEYAISAGAIADMGYNVILAHADRYNKDVIDVMLDYGVSFLQLNPYALAAPLKRKHIYKWLEDGLVCALGSDLHGTSHRAYRKLDLAKKRIEEFLPQIKKASDKIWGEIADI